MAENGHPHVARPALPHELEQQAGARASAIPRPASSTRRSTALSCSTTTSRHYLKRDHGKMTPGRPDQRDGASRAPRTCAGVEVLPYALKIIGTPSTRRWPGPCPSCGPGWPAARTGSTARIRARRATTTRATRCGSWTRGGRCWSRPSSSRCWARACSTRSRATSRSTTSPAHGAPVHGTPSLHLGSAFDVGFYGIVQKDLRAVLKQREIAAPLNRVYCGNGSLTRCRAALESLAGGRRSPRPPQQVYPADGSLPGRGPECSDSIQFRAIGAITQPLIEWVNRPDLPAGRRDPGTRRRIAPARRCCASDH